MHPDRFAVMIHKTNMRALPKTSNKKVGTTTKINNMKNLKNYAALFVAIMMAAQVNAQSLEKFYRITDVGHFEFINIEELAFSGYEMDSLAEEIVKFYPVTQSVS